MKNKVETQRLVLEYVDENDKAFILQLLNTEGWLKFIGNRGVTNEDEAVTYIQNIHAKSDSYFMVLKLKESGLPIGMVSFMQRDFLNFPDIGFALLPDFEKKGYAFEATKAYLDAIISSKKYVKVGGFALTSNDASISLLKRLGMSIESTFINEGKECTLLSLKLIEDYSVKIS